ncbi:MAG: thiolase family protein [Ardenticatenaceae bacterium]|nr:thiolase family protein [Ardenticatenaceae bacterium]HBY97152.1 acetyl-CoA C-acyltransferase [Chloroflexota bacterium]
MQKAYIVSTARTAIGTYGGSLKDIPPQKLGGTVIRAAVERAGIDSTAVEEVVFGCIGQIGIDAYMARACALEGGLPQESTAVTVNRLCGSGLQAINQAAMSIATNQADLLIAGGVESMSRYPYLSRSTRWGAKFGPVQFDDALDEVLSCPINLYAMGCTAENVADRWHIGREEQDRFALASQRKAARAINAGRFQEQIVPIEVRERRGQTRTFAIDEGPRPETTLEKLSTLRPAFRDGGTVTAGNACGINDGAAAVVVAGENRVKALGLKPLAEVVDFAVTGVDPAIMGIGPAPAVRKLVERTGVPLKEVGVVELNEAFAVQCLAVGRELESLGWDWDKVNPNGGAIALGHPVGATGCILTIKLLAEMRRLGVEYGIVTLCIGGGQGIATLFRQVA